jgi:hypothetical protein
MVTAMIRLQRQNTSWDYFRQAITPQHDLLRMHRSTKRPLLNKDLKDVIALHLAS